MDVRVISGVCVLLLGELFSGSGACNVTLYAPREPLNFTSPNYPGNYRNNDYCYWTIHPQTSGYRVVLDMVYSNIAGSTYSCSDSLTLDMKTNDGGWIDSTHKICGKTRKNVAAPQGQFFYVVFMTDNSITESGFLIRYYETREETGCGRRLEATTASKTFTSPGYPNAYHPRLTCDWTITTKQQNQVVLLETIDALFQNPSATGICYGDYVNVYNGQNRWDQLGSFCGTDKPVFVSSGSSIRVHFHTDDTNNYKGIKMRYTAISATVCNNTLKAASYPLEVVSPAKRGNCVWTIQTSASQKVVGLTILESDGEGPADGPCSDNNGALYVYNGRSTRSSALLGTWCGSSEGRYSSTGNYLTVIAHPGGDKDVRISYREIRSVCGSSNLVASSVTQNYLTSPGYPDNYPDGLNCVWVIYGPPGKQIKVKVLDVEFEKSSTCDRDYIVFRDGTLSNSEIIKRMCFSVTGDIFSSGNHMHITFHSDMSVARKGFRLQYSAVSSGSVCGNTRLTAYTWRRYLTSPGYPAPYANGLDCRWTVVGPVGMSIEVDISYLDMETSATCTRDYLLFSDGGANNASLAKVCRSLSKDIVSTNNKMFITFHTDSSATGRGFSLQYFAVRADAIPKRDCGARNLNASTFMDTPLTSPGYPSLYANNLNCVWTISAPVGNRIRVEIGNIQMETSSGCLNDYLLFSDGISSNAAHLDQLCAATLKYIYSSGTSLTITFHTDYSQVSLGFFMKYKAGIFSTPRACGTDIDITNSDVSNINSPNYPLNYPSDADCTWTVSTDNIGYVIRSSVVHFNTEYEASCSYDYVEIYDGRDASAVSLGRWCGTKGPAVQSSGTILCVVFRSDHSGSRSGFSLSFFASKPSHANSSGPNVGGIIGGTLGAIIFALTVVFCCVWCNRKKSTSNNQPQRDTMVTMVNNRSQDTITNNIYSISFSNHPPPVAPPEPTMSTAPPAYHDVVKDDPPPYCEVVAQLDLQPVVTSYPSGASVNQGVDNQAFHSTEV